MRTNVNERPWFKGLNIEEVFSSFYTAVGYRKRTVKEIIDIIKKISRRFLPKYKKLFEGIEDTWVFDKEKDAEGRVIDIMAISHTSYVSSKKLFKVHDNAWNILIHRKDLEHPLFPAPFNRSNHFIDNFLEYAAASKAAAIHFPRCPICQRQLMWRIIRSNDVEEQYIHYDNRELYCITKTCSRYQQDTGLRVTDVGTPDKKESTIFRARFLRSEAQHRKNIALYGIEHVPLPKRWIRFWMSRGWTFQQSPSVYANDTAHEKCAEKHKWSPYSSDLQHEQDHPYPNG